MSEVDRSKGSCLEHMRRELREKFERLKNNPDEYENRLRTADTVFVLALDLYSDLWDEFPERREELVGKIQAIIETCEKTLRRMTVAG